MTVRVAKFEIEKFDTLEATRDWFGMMRSCQQMANTIGKAWLMFHETNDSLTKWTADMRAYTEWKSAKKAGHAVGDKPGFSVRCFDSASSKYVSEVAGRKHPEIHSRVKTLVEADVKARIEKLKSVSGSLPGWVSVLLGNQGIPSYNYPLPIPFDVKNSELLPRDDGTWRLTVRIERIPTADGKRAKSVERWIELRTKGKSAGKQLIVLKRIMSGEYKFCGSKIAYNQTRRKWFVLLCWKSLVEEEKKATGEHEATIQPGIDYPWDFAIGDKCVPLYMGNGANVAGVRRQLLTQRWQRQEGYRHSSSSTKGHGRNRALAGVEKLSTRWKEFVKLFNHRVSTKVIELCVERGVGRLIYKQPTGEAKDGKLLSNAGKIEDRQDSTSWDYAQFAAMLGYKCKDAGIHLEVVKVESVDESESYVEAGASDR